MSPARDIAAVRPEELYANLIATLLQGVRHVAVGMQSPIPGTGALLARQLGEGRTRVSILGGRRQSRWTNGGAELFDLAGRGGVDAFFLSGGQIDGHGNINLVGVGDYPQTDVRWSGCFGFRLRSVHPGHTLEEVRDMTAFDFELPPGAGGAVPVTPAPDAERLALLRGPVAAQIAEVYPAFARDVFGIPMASAA
jgi:glutaconate CoA-transferase subunit B